MTKIQKTGRALVVLAAVLAGGCSRKEAPAGGAEPAAAAPGAAAPAPVASPGAQAQLDSGNLAYRAHDYTGALAHYRQAAQADTGLAAAWFGMYMAQSQLGDKAGADSSMRKVQALSPGMMQGHPGGAGGPAPGMGTGTLPPGHPAMPGQAR